MRILTNPQYIDGDNLYIKEYYKKILNNHLIYSSLWNWWKKTTLFCSLPIFALCFLSLVVFSYKEMTTSDIPDWALVISCSFLPAIFGFPFVWIGTYYDSFILTRKITRKMASFIGKYLPHITEFKHHTLTNYSFSRNGVKYEMAYTMLPEKDHKGKIKSQEECFLIVLYYKHKDERYTQEDSAHLWKAFIRDWHIYCDGKDSCEHLNINNLCMVAVYNKKEKLTADSVIRTMDQMEYLLSRFNLNPIIKECAQP